MKSSIVLSKDSDLVLNFSRFGCDLVILSSIAHLLDGSVFFPNRTHCLVDDLLTMCQTTWVWDEVQTVVCCLV